jgi:hypothetical protein
MNIVLNIVAVCVIISCAWVVGAIILANRRDARQGGRDG